ncbi:MAG: ABC transporter permease [Thermoleophilia bacterium]|nr:ABC transporter permease [Thermoleophilia bacterium]
MLTKTLRDSRRAFAWWAIGIAGLVALMVAVFPTVRDNEELNALVQEYPEALKGFIAFGGEVDYLSGAGYLGSELFSFMVPLLFLIAAVGAGAGAIAGEEERGTLDLLLSVPVSRARVALEKLAAMTLEVAGLGAVLFACLAAGAPLVDMEVGVGDLAAACVAAVALALVFGGIAFGLGAATGRRALAIGVAVAAAVVTYVVNGLAPLVPAFDAIRELTPFFQYAAGDPLRSGLDVPRVLLLLGAGAVFGAAGLVAFTRRDVAT